jgi:outer membrane protein assembly factor BamB
VVLGLGWPGVALASEWPQYRGANHDGVSGDRILTRWPAPAPPDVWRRSLTNGFSSLTVAGGRAFTLETRGSTNPPVEVLLALDASNGRELWATPVGPADYPDGGSGDGDGPRSTPAVDGGRVYVLSAWLQLHCLSVTNGQVLWSRDFVQEFGAEMIAWQNAASPLLDGDLVYLNCNAATGGLVALRKIDGEVAWRADAGALTHATPVPATLDGVRQVIFFTQEGLASVNATNGAPLWSYAVPFNTTAAASPVVWNRIVYCSASYCTGAAAVSVTRSNGVFAVAELWKKANQLKNLWSTPVSRSGFLYGLFDPEPPSNSVTLRCVDLLTGDTLWSQPGFGRGGVLLVDGRLLVLSEQGELVLAESGPFAYVERARARILSGKCWNVPAVCSGRIFARSTTEAVCLDLAEPPPPAPLTLSLNRLPQERFRLRLEASDGSAPDPNRLPSIQVLTAPDLLAGPADWLTLTNQLVLTNGAFETILDSFGSPGFLITSEPQ